MKLKKEEIYHLTFSSIEIDLIENIISYWLDNDAKIYDKEAQIVILSNEILEQIKRI